MFYWNGDSVNGHVLLEWGFSQCPCSTGMGSHSMDTFYWNGELIKGHILMKWGVSQWPAFYWNGQSVNVQIPLEWGFSQWTHYTGIGSLWMATLNEDGDITVSRIVNTIYVIKFTHIFAQTRRKKLLKRNKCCTCSNL